MERLSRPTTALSRPVFPQHPLLFVIPTEAEGSAVRPSATRIRHHSRILSLRGCGFSNQPDVFNLLHKTVILPAPAAVGAKRFADLS